jgi:hypothetical protein
MSCKLFRPGGVRQRIRAAPRIPGVFAALVVLATCGTAVARDDRTIRPDGIGDARIGMTIGELRASLQPGMLLGTAAPYMVDIDGMPVTLGADTLYYVLILAGESSADEAVIDLLATSHATFRTADAVGPGTTLGAAAALLGAPRLSYHTMNESREFAVFDALPESIMLRVAPAGENAFAGVYATDDEYNETTRYDPAARISMVLVRG